MPILVAGPVNCAALGLKRAVPTQQEKQSVIAEEGVVPQPQPAINPDGSTTPPPTSRRILSLVCPPIAPSSVPHRPQRPPQESQASRATMAWEKAPVGQSAVRQANTAPTPVNVKRATATETNPAPPISDRS